MAIRGGPDIIEDGLVLHLDAADRNSYAGSGSTWYDLSGSGNNGTLTNGPIFSQNNRGCIILDQSDDYIDLSNITISDDWTYEAWWKPQPFEPNVYRFPLFTGSSWPGGFRGFYEPFKDTTALYVDSNENLYIGSYSVGFGDNASPWLARFDSDGNFDSSFDVGEGPNGVVYKILPTSNNKFYLAGSFTSYDGVARDRICRINSDGSLDTSWSCSLTFNGSLLDLVEDSNGNIYISGTHSTPSSYRYLTKIDSSGDAVASFATGSKFNNRVNSISLSSDESTIFAVGYFTTYNGTTYNRIIALDTSDASVDTNYDFGTGFNNVIYSALFANSGIYPCGTYTSYNGTSINRFCKIKISDQTIDTNFDVGTGFNNYTRSADIDSSGNIYVVGAFSSYNGVSKTRMAKLNSSGTIQDGWNYVNNIPSNVLVGPNRVYFGGIFYTIINNEYYHGFLTKDITDGSTDETFLTTMGRMQYRHRFRMMWRTVLLSNSSNQDLSFYPYGSAVRGYDEMVSLGYYDTWQHLVISLGDGVLKMYFNGELTVDYSSAANYNTSVVISSFFGGANVGSIKSYNRVLSSDEILQNYNATKGRYEL